MVRASASGVFWCVKCVKSTPVQRVFVRTDLMTLKSLELT